MKKDQAKVPQLLRNAALIYEERNKAYGDAYKKQGKLLKSFFPDGIELKTVDDFNRFSIFCTISSKMLRYSNNIKTDGHDDSLTDISVYANMLLEIHKEIKK